MKLRNSNNINRVAIWGIHAVRAAWLNPNRECLRLFIAKEREAEWRQTLNLADNKDIKRPAPSWVERMVLDSMTPDGCVHQGCVLEAVPLPTLSLNDITDNMPDIIVALDQVTDPHNIGAVLRSAAAFGAGALIMTERHAPDFTSILAKTASGALEYVPILRVTNLARTLVELGKAGAWRVGFAESGREVIAPNSFPQGPKVLVFGSEGEGLRRLTQENCDAIVRLPTCPPLGSLNVSNAAAVGLYIAKQAHK